MANIREKIKQGRMQKITAIVKVIKKSKKEINKEKLIAKIMVEHAITKRTATEEVEAVLNYEFE